MIAHIYEIWKKNDMEVRGCKYSIGEGMPI